MYLEFDFMPISAPQNGSYAIPRRARPAFQLPKRRCTGSERVARSGRDRPSAARTNMVGSNCRYQHRRASGKVGAPLWWRTSKRGPPRPTGGAEMTRSILRSDVREGPSTHRSWRGCVPAARPVRGCRPKVV